MHMRYVDFFLPSMNVFIEVDGKFWHQDKKDIDGAKDICAAIDGIQTFRIDPSKNITE